MSLTSGEHRTLPVLITLGVLLGAGLAVASPAERRAERADPEARGASPTVSVTPTVTPSASPSRTGESEPRAGRCEPAGPVEGVRGLEHAIRVVAASCAGDRGRGLTNALSHLEQNQGRREEDEPRAGAGHRAGKGHDREHGKDLRNHGQGGGKGAGGSGPASGPKDPAEDPNGPPRERDNGGRRR